MQVKYIGKGHTNFSYNGEKVEVKEGGIVTIPDNDKVFSEYLIRNDFIEVKMAKAK